MEEQKAAYSVREFTAYIKHRLENDPVLRNIWIEGEVSNLTNHRSGHVYFSLKDQDAQVNCVVWRSVAQSYSRSLPKHGEKIRLRGYVSVYPPRGSYQFVVQEIKKTGLGDLHQRFLELKDKLQKEGLFDPTHKQPIPRIPKTIAVLTSPTGAVIRDILSTIERRFPHVKVLLLSTAVQGEKAAPQIVRNIARVNEYGKAEVILLCRGGGSLEDLWGFNEEPVARAIFASKIPIISGVGHETDTTIADFVADRRAPTPTAAAEMAVPIAADIIAYLEDSELRMANQLQQFINYRLQLLDNYQDRLRNNLERQVERKQALVADYARSLEGIMRAQIDQRRQDLGEYEIRLQNTIGTLFADRRHTLALLEMQLKGLDVRKVLNRGYSVTLKDGKMVRDADELNKGDQVETVFEKGRRWMEVKD